LKEVRFREERLPPQEEELEEESNYEKWGWDYPEDLLMAFKTRGIYFFVGDDTPLGRWISFTEFSELRNRS
jgi:hypothetical protein